jgi:Family of unknown function (DUF6226)
MEMSALMAEVEVAFARTAAGLERWHDPHPPPDRIVSDDEYSRVTDPAKWRIIGARADAWIDALVTLGLAAVERDADPDWVEAPAANVTRSDVVTPSIEGGLRLVVCRSRIEDVPDAGVTLGVGDPAVRIAFIPDCGCDACDSGSQDVIDHLDSYIRPVVAGEFRHLWRGRQSITVLEDDRRQARNVGMAEIPAGFRFSVAPANGASRRMIGRSPGPRRGRRTRDLVDDILADPTGWDERSGPSWLTQPHGDRRH